MLCLCLNVHLSGLRHLLNKMMFSSYHQLHKTPRYHIRHLTFFYEHEPSSWMWCRRVALHCINQSSNNYLAFLHHTTIAFNRSNARIPSSEDADPSFLKASSLPSVLQISLWLWWVWIVQAAASYSWLGYSFRSFKIVSFNTPGTNPHTAVAKKALVISLASFVR